MLLFLTLPGTLRGLGRLNRRSDSRLFGLELCILLAHRITLGVSFGNDCRFLCHQLVNDLLRLIGLAERTGGFVCALRRFRFLIGSKLFEAPTFAELHLELSLSNRELIEGVAVAKRHSANCRETFGEFRWISGIKQYLNLFELTARGVDEASQRRNLRSDRRDFLLNLGDLSLHANEVRLRHFKCCEGRLRGGVCCRGGSLRCAESCLRGNQLLLSRFKFGGNLVDLGIGIRKVVVGFVNLLIDGCLRSSSERCRIGESGRTDPSHRSSYRGGLASPGSQRISSHLIETSAMRAIVSRFAALGVASTPTHSPLARDSSSPITP